MIELLLSTSDELQQEHPTGTDFLGEITADNFITGDALASAVGLTAGDSENSNTPWLHFVLDDTELLIPKKPLRGNITWAALYNAGLVFGVDGPGAYPLASNVNQYRTVAIKGKLYLVRLLRGYNTLNMPAQASVVIMPVAASDQSEWNQLIYPVCNGTWASYSASDMQFTNSTGGQSWCQETVVVTPVQHLLRGISSYSDSVTRNDSTSVSYRAWRPVLERID